MSRRTEHSQQALYTGSMLLCLRSPVTDGAGKDPGLQSLQKEQILPPFEGICCESTITEVLDTVTIIVFRQENQSSDSCAHTILTLGKENIFYHFSLSLRCQIPLTENVRVGRNNKKTNFSFSWIEMYLDFYILFMEDEELSRHNLLYNDSFINKHIPS